VKPATGTAPVKAPAPYVAPKTPVVAPQPMMPK
jgi:hypothetical protein